MRQGCGLPIVPVISNSSFDPYTEALKNAEVDKRAANAAATANFM